MDNNMLSQDEIDALLGLNEDDDNNDTLNNENNTLSNDECDAIGEISNISMGTAATTLSSLVNQKVNITTPSVNVTNWDVLGEEYQKPCVAIQVEYKEGLLGTNLLILKEDDVKVITDLMMGGDGSNINREEGLNDLHLSAICEAMNQMIGSSSTSMFSIFNKKIDIKPPVATVIDFDIKEIPNNLNEDAMTFLKGNFVRVKFNMVIGNVVDSIFMQLFPLDFAKELYSKLMENQQQTTQPQTEELIPQQQTISQKTINKEVTPQPVDIKFSQPNRSIDTQTINEINNNISSGGTVEVKPAQFQNFNINTTNIQSKNNIDLIMDVPLEVSVELGRTKRPIREILDFAPGTVIELDKLAGDPVDILVNGKLVAKGEVVVIDEYFAIRITEIINKKITL